tara:strand:- start:611 stop:928 length:318 start_codon:yes stop_codon:yes gene_type:complete
MFADRELECGIPTKIEFPTSNQPMRILINKDCISLKHALDEETPQYMAYIIPPYVSLIANRLVSDAICDVFNPEDAGNHPSTHPAHGRISGTTYSPPGQGRGYMR